MAYGAGLVAARRHGAGEIVDPRPYAVGSIAGVYKKYGHVGPVLPAMGYGATQVSELKRTIDATPCDAVLVATPIDLGRLLQVSKPMVRLSYQLQELGHPDLADVLQPYLRAR
jgi:predicted GTPase